MQIENLTPEQLKNALVPYVEKWAPDCEFKFDETTFSVILPENNIKELRKL